MIGLMKDLYIWMAERGEKESPFSPIDFSCWSLKFAACNRFVV